ncbi:MAG: 3-keto-5-aminohexanoate cleavage protein [Ignavibacteriales bacterium]
MNNKRIITCAITGSIHTPSMSEYLPITPQQIADNAIGAAEAGAAVVHIHARHPENGMAIPDLDVFDEIVNRIRRKNKELVICLTTGGGLGMTVDQRAAVIPHFKPELASCNLGSINWGVFPILEKYGDKLQYDWEKAAAEFVKGFVFQNTFADLFKMTSIMAEAGTKPEFEVYDVGHLYNCAYLVSKGFVKMPVYLQFVTGILGGIMATPYDLMVLHQTADRLFGPGNYQWSAMAAGRNEFPICTQGLLLGSHVRVGMEDNLYVAKGVKAQTNAELVAKIRRIMNELDLEPATPDEAREILGLG